MLSTFSLKNQFEPFQIDLNQSLSPNLLIATGAQGRIESIVNDKYWRIGSEGMGTWYSDSNFWLNSGSALFCTQNPQTIQFSTTESNATFEGRGTIILEATKNGGFKFIPLEGKGTITTEKGGTKKLLEDECS